MAKRKVSQEDHVMSGDDLKRPRLEEHKTAPNVDLTLSKLRSFDAIGSHAIHISLLLTAVMLGCAVFHVEDAHIRTWGLVGLFSYIVGRSGHSLVELANAYLGRNRLQVHINNRKSATLFNAMTKMMAESRAELRDCKDGVPSRDTECTFQVDYVSGERKVKLGFWGRYPRREKLSFLDAASKRHEVTADYEPGNSYVSREPVMMEQSLIITTYCGDSELSEKHAAIRFLCQVAYDRYMTPEKGTIDVYFPYARSHDWAPEWKHERSIKVAARSSEKDAAVGLQYYMSRSVFSEVLNDAMLWSRDKLRVYILYGPPGVGKSFFVTKLAQVLGLPIYRARLTGSLLNDDRLQQLFSASGMLHEAALVHFDEFQGVLDSWRTSTGSAPSSPCKVTEEGFNEFLQGGSSMQKGVVILTGSLDLGHAFECFPALFRRAACICHVTPLESSEVEQYCAAFLKAFVDLPPESWQKKTQQFVHTGTEGRPWSIDCLQQYLMKRITKAADNGLVEKDCGAESECRWKVHKSNVEAFWEMLLDAKACLDHLEHYAIKF